MYIKMEPLDYNENIDTQDLNERANIVESYEEVMDIIKEYQDIIKTNAKKIIFFHINKIKFLKTLRKTRNLKVLLNNLK